MAKTYTAVPSVSTGDVYTAANYNTYTATNVSNLIVPPMVRVAKSATQSIATITATTVTFSNAATFNTDSMHDAVINNTRLTINTPGVYSVTGGAWFATNATGTYRITSIWKNGVEVMSSNMKASAAEHRGFVTTLETCAAGDYFELVVYQDSGGAVNTYNHNFMAHWVGRTS